MVSAASMNGSRTSCNRVPYALKNIRWLLHHAELPIALPTLLEAFKSIVGSEKLQSLASETENLVRPHLQFFIS